MPIFSIGALVAGGLAIAGDAASAWGTANTNDTNRDIHNADNQAAWERQVESQSNNNAQAEVSRQWSAQQIQNQEDFQRQQIQGAEDYNTTMSNTAMQRRMSDLRAAGVNPLLAVSQGGASAPTISPQAGSITSAAQASSSPAGAPGGIPMQNTGAAFGNLGGQMTSAFQLQSMDANIDLMRAQANKLNTEAGTEIPAQVEYLKSMTGLNDRNATQAYYNTMRIQEQIYGERLSNDQLRDVTTPMGQQNLQVLQATRDALISASQSDATAKQLGLQKLRNMNEIEKSNFGQILNWIDRGLSTTGTAAGIATKLPE
jgi:hypothetical protein